MTFIHFEPLQTHEENPCFVNVSPSLLKKWKLPEDSVIPLTIGQTSKDIRLISTRIPANLIQIPVNLLTQFHLPLRTFAFIVSYFEQSQSLKAGPVIGMLTNFQCDENGEPNFRSVHSFCEELEKGVRELGGFFYVFPYNDFSEEMVRGFYYAEDQWVKSELPLPDVIYNRIHSRKLEIGSEMQSFRERIDSFGIPFFNERFFSKWEVYSLLNKEDHLLPFLPETLLLTKESFLEMTNRHDTVFIKPIHGSQGRNILKITRVGNLFSVQSSTNHHESVGKDSKITATELLSHFQKFFTKKWCIIQQGIELIDYHGRQIDFRVLCHRNPQNIWSKTSTVARISAEQQFVSNIAQGGEIMKPTVALSSCFSKQEAMSQTALMVELAIESCTILSQHTKGILGELGVDIGMDRNGSPWIIEINSKPSKNFEEKSSKIRPSAKAIIRYCTALAFEKHAEEED